MMVFENGRKDIEIYICLISGIIPVGKAIEVCFV
jgi:hypothetical protein